MKTSISLYFFISILLACVITNIFAYPIFSKYTNLTANDVQKINNYHETELYPYEEPNVINDEPQNEINRQARPEITVSNLNWFHGVDFLIPHGYVQDFHHILFYRAEQPFSLVVKGELLYYI